MDKYSVFKKIAEGKDVYLLDRQENCMLKCYNDNGIVGVMLKRKGESPYRVDVRDAGIFEIMLEAAETQKEVYDDY